MLSRAPLQRIGNRYELVEQLGEGGMGIVYRALDRLTGTYVALKRVFTPVEDLMFNTRAKNAGSLRLMLIKEFEVLASLRHPNVISVLDYGFDAEKQPYYTMECLPNALSILDYGRGRPRQTQIDLLVQLLRALAYLHRRGVLHRDIKPGNVLISGDQVRVLDFGLSQAAGQAGQTGGTLSYMAPEVLMGDTPESPSDLYAVGIIAYELFSGEPLYDAASVSNLIDHILYTTPDVSTLDVDEAVKAIILRLLAKDPSARYRDAGDVIQALKIATGLKLTLETSAVRESVLSTPRFVGRDAELQRLSDALDQLVGGGGQAGRGAAFLIGGESGIGKSRLLSELRIKALVQGATVIWGQSVEGSGLRYYAWRDVIRRLALSTPIDDLEASILSQIVPDIGALLERTLPPTPYLSEYADRQHLMLTIIDLFRRQQQPVVLIFEDVQWMYEGLDPLRWLSETIHTLPVLLLASYRSEDAPTLPDELPAMELITLARLKRDDIQALSVSMIGAAGDKPHLIDLLERETEGNAFFLIEVVRALAERAGSLDEVGAKTLPHLAFVGGLQEVIARRLLHVPAEAHPLLRLAAVAGRWIDLKVMRHLAQSLDLEDWISVCVNAGALDVSDGRYRFAHDKIRQAVLLSIPGGSLPVLHRDVAEAIEQAYPSQDSVAAILANHWHLAGDVEQECAYAQRAGTNALAFSYFREAKMQFRRALQLVDDGSVRVMLYKLLADAEEKLGDYAAAIHNYECCITLSAGHNHDPQVDQAVADAWVGLGVIAVHQSKFEAADKFIKRGDRLHAHHGNPRGRATSLLMLGVSASSQGDYALAKEYATLSLAMFREVDDLRGAANALHNLGQVAYLQGDYFTAQEHFRQGMLLRRSIGDRWGVATSLNDLGSVACQVEDFSTAQQYHTESLAIRREIGDRWGMAASLDGLGEVAMAFGSLIDAHDYFHEALVLHRELGDRQGAVHDLIDLVSLLLQLDKTEVAYRYLTEAATIARQLDQVVLHLKVLIGVAWVRVYLGLPMVAATLMNVVLNHPAAPKTDTRRLERLRMQIETALTPMQMAAAFAHSQGLTLEAVLVEAYRDLGVA